MGDCQDEELRVQFDRRLKLKFLGSQVTTDERQSSTKDLAGRYFGRSEPRNRGYGGENVKKSPRDRRGGVPLVIIATLGAWIGFRLSPNQPPFSVTGELNGYGPKQARGLHSRDWSCHGDAVDLPYVREPFLREQDFGVTSVNYALGGQMARAEAPA